MKTIKQTFWASLTLWLLVVVGVSSCSQDDLLSSEDQLTISETEITLSGSGDTAVEVDVQSNTLDWSYVSGAPWLHITRSAKGLSFSADRNTTGALRHTTVGLTVGSLVRKLEVSQRPVELGEGEGSIYVENREITATQWGGVITIPVVSESQDWDVLPSEDWLTAVANPRKKTVVVTIPETMSRDKRSANLLIQDRETGQSVVVAITQDGVLYFLEPFLKFGASMAELEALEATRKSTLTERPGSSWSNTDRLKFSTISPLFTRVEYVIKNDVMTEGYIYAPITPFIAEEENILNWLAEAGYQEAGPVMLFHPEKRTIASFGVVSSAAEVFIRFIHKPQQTAPQATFETLPLGIVKEKNWQDYTKARVHEWETANKGETTPRDERIDERTGTRQIVYYPGDGSTSFFSSTRYTLKLDEGDSAPLKSVMHVLPDEEEYIQKVFWNLDGAYHLTDEFTAIAKAAGFEYYGTERDGSHKFVDQDRKTSLNVRLIIPSITMLNPFVTFTYEYSPE